ncbi:MAG: M23 family metallopeptidase [Fibrobacterales bacterium]
MLRRLTLFSLCITLILLVLGCQSEEERTRIAEKKAKAEHVAMLRADSIRVQDSIIAYKAQFVHGAVKPNQGMFQVLEDMGISTQSALDLINTLRFEVELTNLKVGEKLRARFDTSDSTRIAELQYEPNMVTIHCLIYDKEIEKYTYKLKELPTEIRHTLYESELKEGSTLDQTLREIGLPSTMVGVVNGVLKCKINFRMYARHGDTFKILMKERYYKEILISSKVLYTTYSGQRTGSYEAFRFQDADPRSTYNAHYTAEGEALIHSGLRYPVRRLHITSSWGWRRHPVTGRRKMHNGIDYKGRIGDPVYAVASGKVVASSYDKYGGNKIAVRHSDKSTSYYLHLTKRLVKKGQYVRTRQKIGTVGKTGRVTGPHLHFGFKNPRGRWMNPLRKRMIATPKLKGERLALLKEQVSTIQTLLEKTVEFTPSDSIELDPLSAQIDTLAQIN